MIAPACVIRPVLTCFVGLLALATATLGCGRLGTPIDPDDIPKLKLCHSRGADAENLFGDPYWYGHQGELTLRRWSDRSYETPRYLVVATDPSGTIVDVAYNPELSYVLHNRCGK